MHTREVEGKNLTFIVSGKLWRNSLVMQDKETGSLWSHITGECLEGEYLGTVLQQVPSVQTTWAQWSVDHPQTRVLKKSEEIKSSVYTKYFENPERTGMFRTFWLEDQMPGKTLILGITLGPHALAVADSALEFGTPLEQKLGDVSLTITRGSDAGVRAVRNDTGEEIVVRLAYWFAWSTFYPNTLVVD